MSRDCPLCGWATCAPLKRVDYALAQGSALPSTTVISLCDKCGFVYANSDAKESDYLSHYQRDSIYAASDIRAGSGAQAGDAERLSKAASRLAPHLGPHELFVDIGAATGGLLRAVQSATGCDALGLDPDPACVEIMRSRGFPAERATLAELPRPLFEQASAIALSHVLEHLWNPCSDFCKAISLLRTGGVAYLETPNAARYHQRPNALLYYFDPEHINHFTLRDFDLLALFTGCSVIDSGEDDIALENGDLYPIAWAILRKEAPPNGTVGFQGLGDQSHPVLAYIESQSAQESALASALLDPLKASAGALVWGAGSHAQRMLAGPAIPTDKILGVIDSDSSKAGKLFLGKPILSPESAFALHPQAPVLIVAASAAHSAISAGLATRWPDRVVLNAARLADPLGYSAGQT